MWESREMASQGFPVQLGEEHPEHSPPACPPATIADVEMDLAPWLYCRQGTFPALSTIPQPKRAG